MLYPLNHLSIFIFFCIIIMDYEKLEKYLQTYNEDLLIEYLYNNVDTSYNTYLTLYDFIDENDIDDEEDL